MNMSPTIVSLLSLYVFQDRKVGIVGSNRSIFQVSTASQTKEQNVDKTW